MYSSEVRYSRKMDSYDALRRNLAALLDAAKDGLISGPAGVLQLEAVTDIGKSTLYRILDPRMKNPTQLDVIERIASAYSLQGHALQGWQLLVPNFNPLDPPATMGQRQMAVLRSVFAQTQGVIQDGHDESTTAPRAQGAGARGTDNRPHTGGRTVAGGTPPATVDGRHGHAGPVGARKTRKPKS